MSLKVRRHRARRVHHHTARKVERRDQYKGWKVGLDVLLRGMSEWATRKLSQPRVGIMLGNTQEGYRVVTGGPF